MIYYAVRIQRSPAAADDHLIVNGNDIFAVGCRHAINHSGKGIRVLGKARPRAKRARGGDRLRSTASPADGQRRTRSNGDGHCRRSIPRTRSSPRFAFFTGKKGFRIDRLRGITISISDNSKASWFRWQTYDNPIQLRL